MNKIYAFNFENGRIVFRDDIPPIFARRDFQSTIAVVHHELGGDEIGGVIPHCVSVHTGFTLVYITDDPNHEYDGFAILPATAHYYITEDHINDTLFAYDDQQ